MELTTEETIESLDLSIAACRAKIAPLERQLRDLLGKQRQIMEKRDEKIVRDLAGRLDVGIMLTGNPTRAIHVEQRRQLESIGLRQGGFYSPETGQAVVEFALTKGDSSHTKRVLSGLELLFPHIAPREGERTVSIFERSLSAGGSWNLGLCEQTGKYRVYLGRWRGHGKEFDTLAEALNYCESHVYYEVANAEAR